MGPTYILGCTHRTEAETLSWLSNPERAIFCFPAKTVGPDLIFLLRLSDHSLIRVHVQFKHPNEGTISSTATTGPNQFDSHLIEPSSVTEDVSLQMKASMKGERTAEPRAAPLRNPNLNQDSLAALKDLGTGSTKAGELNVLRVLATFPAKSQATTFTDLVESDTNGHPDALLNVESLTTYPSEKELLESLRRGVVEAAMRRRREE